MNKTDLTEYADFLLKNALAKSDNLHDAQDLVQETLLAALVYLEQGKNIDEPKNWLLSVMKRKYYDKLRIKYRRPTVSYDIICDMPDEGEIYDAVEHAEEAEAIRRSLAHLTKIYRQVMVKYYVYGMSVKNIASSLEISESAVKSRLETGRSHIRKDFTMENYARQSYEPEVLWLSCSGSSGIDDAPFSIVGNDRIAMNLLILAYEKPVTVKELSGAIGIPTAYIEPVIERLVAGELMKKTGDKVSTDFIIYTVDDKTKNFDLEKKAADELYTEAAEILENELKVLREKNYFKRMARSQQVKLESHFGIHAMLHSKNNVRDMHSGHTPWEDYPDRPNGGKWFAMGERYSAGFKISQTCYNLYSINGEMHFKINIDRDESPESEVYYGAKSIGLSVYGTHLHQQRGSDYPLPSKLSASEAITVLWTIYNKKFDDLHLIGNKAYKSLQEFEELRYLKKGENGRYAIDIPVLSRSEELDYRELLNGCVSKLTKFFEHRLDGLWRDPIEVPEHIQNVPGFQKYFYCAQFLPMMILLNMRENGLFLKDWDEPVTAAYLAYDK